MHSPGTRLDPHYYTSKAYRPIASDPQRHLVFRMERELLGQALWTTTHLQNLRNVARHACRPFRVKPPTIRVISDGPHVYGVCYDTGLITLNNEHHGQNLGVLLHELSHHIHWGTKGGDDEAHGPTFMGIYMYLLDRYRMMPLVAMEALCNEYGVIWTETNPD